MSSSARTVHGSGTTGSIRQSDLGDASSTTNNASPVATDRTAHGQGQGPMSFNPTATAGAAAPATHVYDARNGDTETDATATADTSATATPTLAGGLASSARVHALPNDSRRPQTTTSPFGTSHMASPFVSQQQQQQPPLSGSLAAGPGQLVRPAQVSIGGVGPSSGAPPLMPVSAGPTHRRGRGSGSAAASGGAAMHLRYEALLDDNHGGGAQQEGERLLAATNAGRNGGSNGGVGGVAVSLASISARNQQPVVGGVVKSPLAPTAGGAINPTHGAVGSGGASIVASSMPLNAGPVPTKQLGPPVLTLKNISKSFAVDGGNEIIHALHSISLCEPDQADGFSFPAIRQGEFVMIRGPSGGGKTTLLNMVGTIDAPTKGTIELMGEKITKDSPDAYLADLRLRRIGFVFQTFNLLPTMSALENVELPMTLVGKLNEQERRSRAKQLLALVGLRNRVHHLPSELSGGEQQRVTIARALANNPDLLLLDEPTGDLDTATTIQVMDLLLQINCMSGTTCIMVTHNPDVECYADRILYVADGRFVRQAVNTRPVPLVRDDYEEYLKEMERRQTQLMLNRNQEGNVKPTATNMASVEF